MELRKDAKWSLVIPTSMGVRLTPDNQQPVQSSTHFTMTATSAESNVGAISSYLGQPVKILTNFVEGSPISQFIKSNLRARFMDYEARICRKMTPGVTVTSSTSPTPDTGTVELASGTTDPARSACN